MKRDLKADIMETSQRLFQQRGYNAVSMRDIADALGISVGNLTYHFPKKEALIEAVLEEQHRGYQKPATPETLEELHMFFRNRFLFQSKRGFYFRHYTQLADLCPRVYEMQCTVQRDLHDILCRSLARLEAAGSLKPEPFPGQREGLTQAVMLICVYGGPHMERIWKQEPVQMALHSLWSIMAPCLTEAGLEQIMAMRQTQ